MSGSLIALLSAVCFAASTTCTRRGVLRIKDASLGVYVSVFMAPPLFLLMAVLWGDVHSIASFTWLGYVWLALAGIIHFVAGRSFNYLAVRHLGANIAGVFSALNLLYTVLLGYFVLGEHITRGIALGSLFIIVGPALLAWSPRRRANSGSRGENAPRLSGKGIVAAMASGLFFGISPLFVKLGLQEGGSALAGTFVSYTSAMFILGMTLFNPTRKSGVIHMEHRALIWFTFSGLFVGLAQLLRYTALHLSPLSIAGPIVSTNPLFLLILSYIVNRKIESFRINIIIGSILVVVGAVLVYR